MTLQLTNYYVTETCCHQGCNIQWAFTQDVYEKFRTSHEWWYCPMGHRQHYSGASDADKLRRAEARETALNDQLRAAVRDAEQSRADLIRDRARFANGVCPCCNRSFENVRRHMQAKHPEFGPLPHVNGVRFRCSCRREFDTFAGLRTHQGKSRGPNWDKPDQSSYWAHLTRT